ncbi:MAG: PIN-like domain-containing protein [Gemmatimonadota bacterium]|nr:PIN-like domain-containing protein [Gemmatimonadota bacterium]
MSTVDSNQRVGAGLFDGFQGFRTVTPEDYGEVLTSGMLVPDTNVLLNLYRYNAKTRTDLLAVLERVGDRLWIPHQVVAEFWRNREAALRDPSDMAEATVEALENQVQQVISILRRWANRIALPQDRLDELRETVEGDFTALTTVVDEFTDATPDEPTWDTNKDPVLVQLQGVLEGRVGSPLDPESLDAAVKEGHRRIQAGLPPAFADSGKVGDDAVGDYLVWEQTIREAETRQVDVLLVTGDVKDDWWRRERGEIRGPRPELVEELKARAGARLFMLRPESLLFHARSVLQVEVSAESLQEVERVDRFVSIGGSGGWTTASLDALLQRLAVEAPVQESAIELAAQQDGFVSREEVYQLGGYDETRTLRGFTRPVRRIAQTFRDQGIIPPGAIELLEAEYDAQVSYVQAAGFRVPIELVPLLSEIAQGS